MDQFVLLLIIAAISFINWLLQKSADHKARKAKERQLMERGEVGDGNEIGDFESARSDQTAYGEEPARGPDEATRRLMEALGLPTESLPPPPIVREIPQPPPLQPSIPPPFEPVKRRSFAHKIDASLEERLKPAEIPRWNDTESRDRRALRRANDMAGNEVIESEASKRAQELIRSREGLQASILAREILGPPKGLVFDL